MVQASLTIGDLQMRSIITATAASLSTTFLITIIFIMIQQRFVAIFIFILILKYTVQSEGSGNRRFRRQIIPVSYKKCPPGERFDAFSRCVTVKPLKHKGGKFRAINIPTTSSTEMVITTRKSILTPNKLKFSNSVDDKGSTTSEEVILRNVEDVTVKSTTTVTQVAEFLQERSTKLSIEIKPSKLSNETQHSILIPANVITKLGVEMEEAEVGNVPVQLEQEQLIRKNDKDRVVASSLRQAYHQHHRCYKSSEVRSSRRSAYEDYEY